MKKSVSVEMSDGHLASTKDVLLQAWAQWKLGEWNSLSSIDYKEVTKEAGKAELALLVGAALFQLSKTAEARKEIALARELGVNKQLVCIVVMTGAYNSLGRAAAFMNFFEYSSEYFDKAEQYTKLVAQPLVKTKRNIEVPRLIIINGMSRSGSTVSMNIVIDLLNVENIPHVKYYIDDFDDLNKLKDHLIQNENICFILKTHGVDSELESIAKEFQSCYLYTKRDLVEVAASYARMTKVNNSPFFREEPVDLNVIKKFLGGQVNQKQRVKTLKNVLVIDCDELADSRLNKTIYKIADHINVSVSLVQVTNIARARSRESSAIYSSNVNLLHRTSLGHERETFFHKNHVMAEGTNVGDELPEEWIENIYREFY